MNSEQVNVAHELRQLRQSVSALTEAIAHMERQIEKNDRALAEIGRKLLDAAERGTLDRKAILDELSVVIENEQKILDLFTIKPAVSFTAEVTTS